MGKKQIEMMLFPRMQVYVTPAILGHVTHPSENAHLIYPKVLRSQIEFRNMLSTMPSSCCGSTKSESKLFKVALVQKTLGRISKIGTRLLLLVSEQIKTRD